MAVFLVLTLLIGTLQVLHLKMLRHVLPPRWHRALPWVLLALHAPLAVYMALRLTGHATHGLGPLLRPFARGALYFQSLTVLALIWGALSEGLWYLWRVHLPEAKRPPFEVSRRHFMQGAAMAGLATAGAGGAHGAGVAYGPAPVTRRALWFPDLPKGLDGLKLAFLSDLHAGPLVSQAQLRTWREQVAAEGPDLVLYGGDFVDSLPQEVALVVEAFGELRAPLGAFAVLGNHDYFSDPAPIWGALGDCGITCLENRGAPVARGGDTLWLLGLQDPMARNGRFQGVRFGPGPDPAAATRDLPAGGFRLCLAHRPSTWPLAREAGAQLTLSGHTHGGQVNLVPGLSSARILGPHTHGLYAEGRHLLYVSRGLGVVGLPLRIGAPPELVCLTLRRG